MMQETLLPSPRWGVSISKGGGKLCTLCRSGNASKNCSAKESRQGSHPRPTSRSPASVRATARRLSRGGATARPVAGRQAHPPVVGRDRVRGPRGRPPPRCPHFGSRPGRAQKRGYQGSSMTCPGCKQAARCKGFRPRTALSLLGVLRLRRHYYLCPHCHQGTCPLDELLRLRAGDLTPAADAIVCLAGVQASFAEAADKTLPRLAGLRVSESTVERATEAAGTRIAQAQAAGQTFGSPRPWAWHKDAEGKTVGYVAVDATGVGMQGDNGAQAEGRMAYVGMVYNPVPEQREQWADPTGKRPPWQARYVAGVHPLAALNRDQIETRSFRFVGCGYTIRRYSPDKEPQRGNVMVRVEMAKWGQCLEDLRRASLGAAYPRTRERFQALYLIASGQFNATSCALHVGRHDETVLGWVHRYNAHGPAALAYRRSGGRAPLLTSNKQNRSLRPSRTPSRPTTACPAITGR